MLRRRRSPSPTRVEPELGALDLLDAALSGRRPGKAHPSADRAWLAARRRIRELTMGTPYDPRVALGLTAADLDAWREARRAWLRERWSAPR